MVSLEFLITPEGFYEIVVDVDVREVFFFSVRWGLVISSLLLLDEFYEIVVDVDVREVSVFFFGEVGAG